MNYYVDLTNVEEADRTDYTVVFTVDGEVADTAAYNAASYRDDLNGDTKYYRYTVYVTSVQMVSEITATLMYQDETQIGTNTYSVMAYCEKSIANGWSSKDLCEALLNFGGYAEAYFDSLNSADSGAENTTAVDAEGETAAGTEDASGETSGETTVDASEESTAQAYVNSYISGWDADWTDPVTSGEDLTEELKKYSSGVTGTLPDEIAVNGETGSSFTATLRMQSSTVIRIYFNLADGCSPETLTFTADGTTLAIEEASEGDTCYGEYAYYVEVDVPANRLSDTWEISVTGTDTSKTAVISYSALTYVKNKLGDGGTEDTYLQNLCRALYYYSKAADSYADWN